MLALTGPNSITCGQIFAMKRPSEVPPVVDSVGVDAGCSRIEAASASLSSPGVGQEGLAAERPGDLVVEAVAVAAAASTRAFSDSGVDSVLKRKLKSTISSPGITLPAPVPAWMFDTCQEVGWKCSLPRSQSIATSSASAGATQVDRILRQLRVGDVALHAVDARACR